MHTVIIGLSISTPTWCYRENFEYVDTSIILCVLQISGSFWKWVGEKGTSTLPSAARLHYDFFLLQYTGLLLRAGGQEFPVAAMNVAPGYFPWKIEEK